MKKKNLLLVLLLLVGLIGNQALISASTTLKVGASPTPHAAILEEIKPLLAKEGIDLKIIEFQDYVQPNLALAEGELDANFFQHEPYMKEFASENNIDIVSLGKVHIETFGLYSTNCKSIDELKDNSVIAIPNDPTNGGRALLLLEKNGLIKLKGDAGLLATENDIIENPKDLKFTPLEAAQLPRVLKDVDGAVINGNYALEAGLVPAKDALIIEDKDSPYANIIAIRKGEEKKEKYQKLLKALQSEKVKEFIEENSKYVKNLDI